PLVVIGGDVTQVLCGLDSRVENGHRNTLLCGAFNDGNQRFTVRGSQRNAVDTLVYKIFYDADLAGKINFGSRTLPPYFLAKFLTCGSRPRVNRLPKNMGLPLRHHRDHELLFSLTSRSVDQCHCQPKTKEDSGPTHSRIS